MADNYTTNPGAGGATFASDDVGGVQYPRVKITHGADGAAQDASADAPLPVADSAAATALAAILAKIIAAPATAQAQADQLAALGTLQAQTDGVEASLSAILAKLSADPATQTTLAAVLAKISADPSTATLQSAANALLTTIRDRTPALVGGAQPIISAAGTLTDRSGTITAGGTAQQLMAANAARIGFAIQNLSATADLWINPLGAAAASQPSIKLVPGAYFEAPAGFGAVGAISVFSATTGVAFSAREY